MDLPKTIAAKKNLWHNKTVLTDFFSKKHLKHTHCTTFNKLNTKFTFF